MTREESPSKGWKGTADDMDVEPGLPEQLEESAVDLREIGYDDLAKRLVRTAAEAREVTARD